MLSNVVRPRPFGLVVTFLLGTGWLIACGTSGVPNPEMHALIGSWSVADTSGGMIQFGFRIDESDDSSVTGVVQRVFAGNVGIDVSRFDPLRGQMNDNRIKLRATRGTSEPPLEFEFERVDDGLRVIDIQWGGESLVRTPNTWVVWRG